MKVRVAVEFELEVEMNKSIEGHVDEFIEDFARAMVDETDTYLDYEGAPISISYLDFDWTKDMPLLAKDAL